MNSAKRYLVIALSFAICMTVFAAFAPRIARAATAIMVQVVNTPGNPVPIGAATHLAQPETEIVMVSLFPPINGGPARVHADGSVEFNWSVPAGKVFVVTDYSYQFNGPANTSCNLSLLGAASNPVDSFGVKTDGSGFASGREQVAAVIGAGATPVFLPGCLNSSVSGYGHGYLTAQ